MRKNKHSKRLYYPYSETWLKLEFLLVHKRDKFPLIKNFQSNIIFNSSEKWVGAV